MRLEARDPDATTYKGCDATCEEHGSQEDVFKRIVASAAAQGLPGPHNVLYMNSVYLWPFDAASALGTSAMVTDVHGKPHEENCDPGIFPSYFFDFGKPAGAKSWLDIIRKHIVQSNVTDGVYCDCCGMVPFHCDGESENATCFAKRNGKTMSTNEVVTPATVDAYTRRKQATLAEAVRLVTNASGNAGTFYNKVNHGPTKGLGNIEWIKVGPPPQLHAVIKAQTDHGGYVVVGGSNAYSNPKQETTPAGQNISDGRSLQRCPDNMVAQFLLGLEPGAYLLCNGWDSRFGRPLGKPLGPPVLLNGSLWSRSFRSGVVATWDLGKKSGRISWPGVGPPSPTPHPPAPSPAPPPPSAACPGPECPPVPASNFKGCYIDHVHGKCDLPHIPPHGNGHCKKTMAAARWQTEHSQFAPGGDSVERCNSLCAPLGYKYFGLQAGHACFCGNSFGSMGAAPHESDCSARCRANQTEICGGADFNSVYEVVQV